jgi:hypothetical protein
MRVLDLYFNLCYLQNLNNYSVELDKKYMRFEVLTAVKSATDQKYLLS